MIRHLTKMTVPAGNAENDLTDLRVTERHEVIDTPGGPVVETCDRCARVVVRGAGAWWEWAP